LLISNLLVLNLINTEFSLYQTYLIPNLPNTELT
jgi:hypothetical protein